MLGRTGLGQEGRMSFSLGDRLGLAGVVLALAGIAVPILWPEKKWIGWLSLASAMVLIGAWVWMECAPWILGFSRNHRLISTLIVFLFCGVVGAALWNHVLKKAQSHVASVVTGHENASQSTETSNSANSSIPSISKVSSLSVVVPVATVSQGRPIRRIPFDENINDPKLDFYRDLGMLSQRPFENPPGITSQEKPLGDATVARIFLAELLQYYILHEIRVLQRGTLAFSVTKFLGKETAVAKAIDVPPVPVPDPVPYPIEDLFRALEGNEFLNVYSYSKSTKDGT